MTTTICSLIVTAMVITSVCNFIKSSISWILKKKQITLIAMGASFVLGLIAAFSINFWIELEVGAKILLWLALWTGSWIWYDARSVIQEFSSKKEEE